MWRQGNPQPPLITAQIAAYLTRQNQDALEDEIDSDIARLERKVEQLSAAIERIEGALGSRATEEE